MTTTHSRWDRSICCLAIVLGLSWYTTAIAQNGTWTNPAGGDYLTASNWAGNQIAQGAGNTANFNTLDITDDLTLTVTSPVTLGSLIFGDTDTASGGSWELFVPEANLTAAILTLDNGAAKPTITVNQLTPGPLGFDDAFLGPRLSGTNGFIKTGPGILTLGQRGGEDPNTITGGIDINGGTLRLQGPIPGQAINMANNTTLETGVTLDANIAPGGGAFSLNVPSGATANIRTTATVELGNFNAAGATLNINLNTAGSTLTADGDWAVNGSPAAVNLSSTSGGFFRMRPNSGSPNFNTTNAFADTHVTLDNITVWTRTNSGGNNVNIGALSGTSTAVIAGGAQGGGTAPRYIIGALNTDTEYAGAFDSLVDLPDPEGGLHIVKVGTGTLTLSGTVNNVPRPHPTNLPWRRGGVTQVQQGAIALKNSTVIAGGVVDPTLGPLFSTIDVQASGTLDVTQYTAGTYATQPLQQIVGAGNIVGNWNHADGIIRPGNTVPDLGASTTITSPNTTAVAGTITFNGNLTLSGGSIGYDMSLDPNSGNDLVRVTGTTHVTGGTVVPNFFNGIPSSGTYTILTSDGGITGNVGSMTVDMPGRGVDPIPFVDGNSIKFSAVPGGGSANLIWTGANGGVWNVESTQAWTNNGSPDVFFDLDNVTFNDAPISSTVTVAVPVSPSTVVINNNTTHYTFTSTGGSISGTTGLTKTGAGNLTMQMGNSYTGPTSLQGGTIDISSFGQAFGVGTLAIDGVTIVGTTAGGFGNSSLAATGNNVIQMSGNSASGNTFSVPNLSGSGTLTITSDVADKWFALNNTTDFNGTINLVGPDAQTPIHVRLVAGSSFGVLNMSDARVSSRSGTGGGTSTFAIGELHGDDNTRLRAFEGGSPAVNAIWQIGGANTNSDFAGIIEDGAGSNNTTSVSHVTKVGTGTLTLSGANTYTGNTTVQGGTLSITQPFLADEADVILSNGTTLNLNFGATDTIRSLYIGGTSQQVGTWGAPGSGAMFTSPLLTGTGLLNVTLLGPPLGLQGDFNGDGSVDAADYVFWRRNDGSQDGYNLWRANFGQTLGGSGAASDLAQSAVPEPASWLLAALALSFIGTRRKLK